MSSTRRGNRPIGRNDHPMMHIRPRRPVRHLVSLIAASAIAVSACGSDSTTSTDLSPAAQEGERVARSAGCASCHGSDWGGGVGPSWQGLAGSTVELADGSSVVADEAYLTEAIADPSATKVKGYTVAMPQNSLSETEIASVVTLIEELGATAP